MTGPTGTGHDAPSEPPVAAPDHAEIVRGYVHGVTGDRVGERLAALAALDALLAERQQAEERAEKADRNFDRLFVAVESLTAERRQDKERIERLTGLLLQLLAWKPIRGTSEDKRVLPGHRSAIEAARSVLAGEGDATPTRGRHRTSTETLTARPPLSTSTQDGNWPVYDESGRRMVIRECRRRPFAVARPLLRHAMGARGGGRMTDPARVTSLRVSVYGVPPGKERVSRHWWRRALYAYCPPYRWWRNSALYHRWMAWRIRRTSRKLAAASVALQLACADAVSAWRSYSETWKA